MNAMQENQIKPDGGFKKKALSHRGHLGSVLVAQPGSALFFLPSPTFLFKGLELVLGWLLV